MKRLVHQAADWIAHSFMPPLLFNRANCPARSMFVGGPLGNSLTILARTVSGATIALISDYAVEKRIA